MERTDSPTMTRYGLSSAIQDGVATVSLPVSMRGLSNSGVPAGTEVLMVLENWTRITFLTRQGVTAHRNGARVVLQRRGVQRLADSSAARRQVPPWTNGGIKMNQRSSRHTSGYTAAPEIRMLKLSMLFACASGEAPDSEAPAAAAECDTDGDALAPQPDRDFLAEFRPVVVRTVPQAGDQAVDPGLTELRVTFSKDMRDESWSWVQVNESQFPDIEGAPRYEDARTNVLTVALEPNHVYAVWLNYDPKYMGFADTHGNSAVPYQLTFRTAAE